MDKGKAIMQCRTPSPPPESSHTGTDLVRQQIVKRMQYYEIDDFQKVYEMWLADEVCCDCEIGPFRFVSLPCGCPTWCIACKI